MRPLNVLRLLSLAIVLVQGEGSDTAKLQEKRSDEDKRKLQYGYDYQEPETAKPTPVPTHKPTPYPTPRPTPVPTPRPSPMPTPWPSPRPTPHPTPKPTFRPTDKPTSAPVPHPTRLPTPNPTEKPTPRPTIHPTPHPTTHPTMNPTMSPSERPTRRPTPRPTRPPTPRPTPRPTREPTHVPSEEPTYSEEPSEEPTNSEEPSEDPTGFGEFDRIFFFGRPFYNVPRITIALFICDPQNVNVLGDLCAAIINTGIFDILNNPNARITIFAPNNNAFRDFNRLLQNGELNEIVNNDINNNIDNQFIGFRIDNGDRNVDEIYEVEVVPGANRELQQRSTDRCPVVNDDNKCTNDDYCSNLPEFSTGNGKCGANCGFVDCIVNNNYNGNRNCPRFNHRNDRRRCTSNCGNLPKFKTNGDCDTGCEFTRCIIGRNCPRFNNNGVCETNCDNIPRFNNGLCVENCNCNAFNFNNNGNCPRFNSNRVCTNNCDNIPRYNNGRCVENCRFTDCAGINNGNCPRFNNNGVCTSNCDNIPRYNNGRCVENCNCESFRNNDRIMDTILRYQVVQNLNRIRDLRCNQELRMLGSGTTETVCQGNINPTGQRGDCNRDASNFLTTDGIILANGILHVTDRVMIPSPDGTLRGCVRRRDDENPTSFPTFGPTESPFPTISF